MSQLENTPADRRNNERREHTRPVSIIDYGFSENAGCTARVQGLDISEHGMGLLIPKGSKLAGRRGPKHLIVRALLPESERAFRALARVIRRENTAAGTRLGLRFLFVDRASQAALA